jgi:small redox-active disulfide protein 2
MRIEILGTGCPKCKKLYDIVKKAVQEERIEAEIIKVTDLKDISKYGVMLTPALVICGEVKASGKLPAVEEIKGWLK